MNKEIKFSIIIPTHNSENYIGNCLKSLMLQHSKKYDFEILIIDDCSSDKTIDKINEFKMKLPITMLSTKINSGPGVARNIGLENCRGEWILFLDSDDNLLMNALEILNEYINSNKELDIVGFNWKYDVNSTVSYGKIGGRYDSKSLFKPKQDLISDYLSLGMDGSVIYTAIRRDLILQNNLKFSSGFHEDIDFIFKVYYFAKNIGYIEDILYIKNNRNDSIVNSIQKKHIDGYFRAFTEMYDFLKLKKEINSETLKYFSIGTIGIIAIKVRDIWLNAIDKLDLYNYLYNEYLNFLKKINFQQSIQLNTKYYIIYDYFISNIKVSTNFLEETDSFMNDISKKSWSCYDLHNSIFFAPDEIRTCCKRFFVDGKMKGDVSLLTQKKHDIKNINSLNILNEKRDLYMRINKGETTECSGCPFLEFKEWGYLNELKPEHISLEYHSICNMKCIYCSDTYYGGKKAKYDIEQILNNLDLKNCKSIVWGGGEPTLDKNFKNILNILSNKIPNVQQRVITNATTFIDEVFKGINENKISITTSIDAGTEETFNVIRKYKKLSQVLENLSKYSEVTPKNVTVKYIFMNENNNLSEVLFFVELVKKYKLKNCNFQISFDFKKEKIDIKSAIAMIVLYSELSKEGVRYIFFDDLLRMRLFKISPSLYNKIIFTLENEGYNKILANQDNYKEIVIWGAGTQTKFLMENSMFFKDVNIKYIVDNTPSKINTKFMGINVYPESKLLEDNYPILISAVQSSPRILDSFYKMGLDKNRLINKLVI
ncbi:glycosyltransferase [Aliarcobacter butzleri]|uniref:glycosyltransferase n=1 Tax=Aliarcobacter butzleri TaxID=28197 RepID=UPI001EDB6787|nr:glycosyltransferase [Aliarcobacter butzleri]MCG3665685.1 glycosyltransferase [Aliarcobacter butzleri]